MSLNMMSQRAVQGSLRRVVGTANTSIMRQSLRLQTPTALATKQVRLAATATPSAQSTIVSVDQGHEILAAQRRVRPVSPHLGIYQPQVTWYLSALNRITGCILSGTFYVFGFGYLVAPYVGLHWESASIAAAFAGLGVATKMLVKGVYAFPFAFHAWNGIRHLIWDTGSMFTNKQVIVTGWTVVAVSALTGLGLIFY